MESLILGIMGKARAGKDTFASRLVTAHGFTRLAFADALKDVALDLDPLIEVSTDEAGIVFGSGVIATATRYVRLSEVVAGIGWDAGKSVREVRRTLQALGVAVRENVAESAWVDAVFAKAAAIDGPVVITDVRFPNEADAVQAAGGKLVRVTRPATVTADATAQHISETALDSRAADFHVANDSTLDHLHAYADAVARTA